MPTRKQRRRRAKEQRHEYEWVIADEEGHEVPVDPAEVPRSKDKGAATVKTASSNGKPAAALKDKRGRTIRPAKPPSWRRAVTRAVIFAAALFLLTSLTQKSHVETRILIALAYGAFGIPFFYILDRTTYRRYLRLVEQQREEKK